MEGLYSLTLSLLFTLSGYIFQCLRVVELPTKSNFQNASLYGVYFCQEWFIKSLSCGLSRVRSCDSLYDLLTFRLRVSLKPKWLYFTQLRSEGSLPYYLIGSHYSLLHGTIISLGIVRWKYFLNFFKWKIF